MNFCDHAHSHIKHQGPQKVERIAHAFFVRGHQFPLTYAHLHPHDIVRTMLANDDRFKYHAEADAFSLAVMV